MNKRTRSCLVLRIIVYSLFGFIFQIDAMIPYGTSKGMKLYAEEIQREKEQKEEKKKQIIADLEKSGEKNTIYLYDESLKHHRVLPNTLWDNVGSWKTMMMDLSEKNEGVPSQVEFLEFSPTAIDSFYDILKDCSSAPSPSLHNTENSGIDIHQTFIAIQRACVSKKATLLDIDTLISIASFAETHQIEKAIYEPLVKNIQQRLMDVFNGKLQLTEDNIRMLNNANSDLRKATLTVPWNISLERIKLDIAKNKKLGGGPRFCSCGIPNSYMTDILISPDNKHVLVVPPGADLWVNGGRLQVKVSVLNSNGAIEWEFPLIIDHPIWINNNKFVYRHEYAGPQKLIIADTAMQTFQEIVFDSKKRHVTNIMLHKGEILFSYVDDQNKLGIGTYDQESNKLIYSSLGDLSGNVLGIDKAGRLLLYNKKEGIIYRLKTNEDNLAEQMLSLTPSDNILSLMASPDGKKIAVRRARSLNVEIYSLETGEKIEYLCNFMVHHLKFSEDSQYLIVAGDKVTIFSALTKEIIGELDSSHQPIFKNNSAVALSADNNTLVMGSSSNQSSFQSLVGTMPNNVLIWDFIPKKYLPAWKKLQNLPPLLENIYPIVSWYHRSQKEERPIKLSNTEKNVFHGFDYNVQQLLTAVGIIAPGQLGKQKNIGQAKSVVTPEEPDASPLQSQESVLQKIMRATGAMAKDFLNYISKMSNALPGSG